MVVYQEFRGVFSTFELRVLTALDCPNIAGAKAPIAPVLNTPLDSISLILEGTTLIQGLCLFSLPSFPGAKSIPESRVYKIHK